MSNQAPNGCRLILLRHGESEWNALDQFTGWVDVGLSPRGDQEALHAGDLLRQENLLPEVLHTSVLRRSTRTAELALDRCDRHWIPVRRSWRLNERHYGALQGRNKRQVRDTYGDERFMIWRRSYDVRPPPLDLDGPLSQYRDPRYAALPPELRPRTECLRDVLLRMLPYWYDAIVPDLLEGRLVFVVAHGNSLRALVKHLDGIPDDEISGLDIPTGVPLLYRLDGDLRRIGDARYLDPAAAAASVARFRNQGSA